MYLFGYQQNGISRDVVSSNHQNSIMAYPKNVED